MEDPPAKSWSIHTRPEITSRYKIHDLIGSGAYSDVYRGTRLADNVTVALKEVHDYQSVFREIEALQILRGAANVVEMHEYFWREDEDAVLVLEYLRSDLGEVIREGKRREEGLGVGEVKRWIMEVLKGVDEVHRKGIVPRDLKPGNLLVGEGGVVKLADLARILLDHGNVSDYDFPPYADSTPGQTSFVHEDDSLKTNCSKPVTHGTDESRGSMDKANPETIHREEYCRELEKYKSKGPVDDVTIGTSINDGNTSCMLHAQPAIWMTILPRDHMLMRRKMPVKRTHRLLSHHASALVGSGHPSCSMGRLIMVWKWTYDHELLTLEPLFPGASDIDQLGRIFNVLGNLTEEAWSGCAKLPDFKTITFTEVESPAGFTSCLPNRFNDEVALVQRLVCYDPAARASTAELLQHKYFRDEPLPVPISKLHVPLAKSGQDEDSSDDCNWYNDMDPDSDFDDFGLVKVTSTNSGFSIQFP